MQMLVERWRAFQSRRGQTAFDVQEDAHAFGGLGPENQANSLAFEGWLLL